jgi:hypothetical protein
VCGEERKKLAEKVSGKKQSEDRGSKHLPEKKKLGRRSKESFFHSFLSLSPVSTLTRLPPRRPYLHLKNSPQSSSPRARSSATASSPRRKKRKKTVIFKARKIIGAMCRLRPAFLLLFVALTVHFADANFSTNDSVRLERRKRTIGDKDIQKRMKAIF